MRAYLVDPYEETVTETEYSGDYQEIAPAIDAQLFDIVRFDDKNGRAQDVFVDDEGLLKLTADSKFFRIKGYPQPLAGKGLILASDREGRTVASDLTLAEAKERVQFMTVREAWANLP